MMMLKATDKVSDKLNEDVRKAIKDILTSRTREVVSIPDIPYTYEDFDEHARRYLVD